mmetsp:Transcript_97604/g.178397  ORF Transcript_97604/g.178397 Transcript_97604/m.178397 type:complete len:673 (+) Transcript_97604:70-2088(+)
MNAASRAATCREGVHKHGFPNRLLVSAVLLVLLSIPTHAALVVHSSTAPQHALLHSHLDHHQSSVSHLLPQPVQLSSSGSRSTERESQDNLPEVKHYKHPGGGYKKRSPLYEKEQEWKAKQAEKKNETKEEEDSNAAPAPAPATITKEVASPATEKPPRLSVGMKCVVSLTVVFFLASFCLFVAQSVNKLTSKAMAAMARLENCMSALEKMLYFIPMLCVLFVAVRLRAVQLTQGQTHQHHLPQTWVNWAMTICTYAVILQIIVASVYFGIFGRDVLTAREGSPTVSKALLAWTRYVIVFFLYVAFFVVCVGIITMRGPEELWGDDGMPKVSPAVFCTMFLASLYFAVHFVLGLMQTTDEMLTPGGKRFGALVDKTSQMREAASTVDIAPILCILFIAVRLRALQLDRENGDPQRWAQVFFFLCTFSVLGQVCVALVVNFVVQPQPQGAESSGSEILNRKNLVIQSVSSLLMFFIYFGMFMILISLFAMTRPAGVTPSLPPSLACVIILVLAYVAVYSASSCLTQLSMYGSPYMATPAMKRLSEFIEKRAKDIVDLCPMICILFVCTFLRALQLTDAKGTPQVWCQFFMHIGTGSLVLAVLSRADFLLRPSQDPFNTEKQKKIEFYSSVFSSVCLATTYLSVLFVLIALGVMTPETANGRGSMTNFVSFFLA